MCLVTKFASILMGVYYYRSKSNLITSYFFKHDKCPLSFSSLYHVPSQPQSTSQIWELSLANQYNYLGYPTSWLVQPITYVFECVNALECWCVCVNVYGGKWDGTWKHSSWNLLCVRYHARFIHIEFYGMDGGGGAEVGGLGEEGEWKGTVWLYSSCLEFLHRSKTFRCCPRSSRRPTHSKIEQTDFLNTASLSN